MSTKDTLNNLLAIADRPAPTDADARFVETATAQNQFARFFFLRVKTDAWINRAVEDVNRGDLDDEGVWYRLLYILRVSSPEVLLPSLRQIRRRLTARMLSDVIKRSLAHPPNVAWAMRDFVADYVAQSAHVMAADLGAYLVHAAKAPDAEPRELLSLLAAVVEFQVERPGPTTGTEPTTQPEPAPRFDRWDYQQILQKAVPELAKWCPLGAAETLLDAVLKLLAAKNPTVAGQHGVMDDRSEIWCQQLGGAFRGHADPDEALVGALTIACEQVFGCPAGKVNDAQKLNESLRRGGWKLLDRVRFHCYAKFPEIALDWIRRELERFPAYREGSYGYEFADMARRAAERFGADLLPQAELTRIFDEILAGALEPVPPTTPIGEVSSADIAAFRSGRVAKNLWPFEPLLFEPYLGMYRAASKESEPVGTGDFQPFSVGPARMIENRSPASADELAAMSDEALIGYLNEWSGTANRPREWWIEITFEGLATAFRQVVESNIAHFERWGSNWGRIKRPIYVRYALETAREALKQRNTLAVEAWLELCRAVTAHGNAAPAGEKISETSPTQPDWDPARRAAADFLAACVSSRSPVELNLRSVIAGLVTQLCVGIDRWLDRGQPLIRPADPLTDAINTTRGRALEVMAQLASWVQSRHGDDPLRETRTILTHRMKDGPPLRIPEYAQLARLYPIFYSLDPNWGATIKNEIFLTPDRTEWAVAFGTFLLFARADAKLLGALRTDYEYAVDHPDVWSDDTRKRNEIIPRIGQHTFLYYVWGLYPLIGDNSLLARFYASTDSGTHAALLQFIGHSLKSASQLEEEIAGRCRALAEWRLAERDPVELAEFGVWLEADCLDVTWRLRTFISTLQVSRGRAQTLMPVVSELKRLLERSPDLVVEAFAELLAAESRSPGSYFDQSEAEAILTAGLSSPNERTRGLAAQAQEALLNAGYFEYLTLRR